MSKKNKEIIRKDRRTFLSVLPIGVLGVVGATLTVAAKRSLPIRKRQRSTKDGKRLAMPLS